MPQAIWIALCDDEENQLANMKLILTEWANQHGYSLRLSLYKNAESFLFDWEEHPAFDIAVLDIEMPGSDGMTLAKRLRESDDDIAIIFATGYTEYIADGYEVSAIQYLIKPIRADKLFPALDKAANRRRKSDPYIAITLTDGTPARIFLRDIFSAEAIAHTVKLSTNQGIVEARMNITALENELSDKGFIRCHRSYLVALHSIQRVNKTEIIMDDKTIIPISRRLYQTVYKAFISYYIPANPFNEQVE